jgi:hypothetical protein
MLRRVTTLGVLVFAVGALGAEPGEADRILARGFPDRDYTRSPIKVMVNSQRCVIAAATWEFKDGGVALTNAAIVRISMAAGRDAEVVEAIEGKSARVTFDRTVKAMDDLKASKILSVETADGRVIRFNGK